MLAISGYILIILNWLFIGPESFVQGSNLTKHVSIKNPPAGEKEIDLHLAFSEKKS